MKRWIYLKKGDIVQEGDLWCGVHGDNPCPSPTYCPGDTVSKNDEENGSYMRLVQCANSNPVS